MTLAGFLTLLEGAVVTMALSMTGILIGMPLGLGIGRAHV